MATYTEDRKMITKIQQALKDRGYKLAVDGFWGPVTRGQLIAFQKREALPIKWPGTIGPTTLKALGIEINLNEREDQPPSTPSSPSIQDSITPPWVIEGRRMIGLHEKVHNKKLSDWLKSDGYFLGDPSKLPWCGDFQETIIAKTLPNEPRLANPYWALNWMKFGRAIKSGIVPLGAIAPFKRPGGGHIGTVVGHDNTYFHILGGNQANSISVTKIAKSRLQGPLRWPITYPMPTVGLSHTTLNTTISHNEA